jgi:hypothetical protein
MICPDYLKILVYNGLVDALSAPTLGALAATNRTNWAAYGQLYVAKLLPWARDMLHALPQSMIENAELPDIQVIWQTIVNISRNKQPYTHTSVSQELSLFFMAKSCEYINRREPSFEHIPWLGHWPPKVDYDYFLDRATVHTNAFMHILNNPTRAMYMCGPNPRPIAEVWRPYIPSAVNIRPNDYEWTNCDPLGRAIWSETTVNDIRYRMIIIDAIRFYRQEITMIVNPISLHIIYLMASP